MHGDAAHLACAFPQTVTFGAQRRQFAFQSFAFAAQAVLLLGGLLPHALHHGQGGRQLRRRHLHGRAAAHLGALSLGRNPVGGTGTQVAEHQLMTQRLRLHHRQPVLQAADAGVQLAALALRSLHPRQRTQRDRAEGDRRIRFHPQAGRVKPLRQTAQQQLACARRHFGHALHHRGAGVQGDPGNAGELRLMDLRHRPRSQHQGAAPQQSRRGAAHQ